MACLHRLDPPACISLSNTVHFETTSDACVSGCLQKAGFDPVMCGSQIIHGVVDRVMEMVGVDLLTASHTGDFTIRPSTVPTFFPGRQADVFFRKKRIGTFGVIHPEVRPRCPWTTTQHWLLLFHVVCLEDMLVRQHQSTSSGD